MQVQNALAIHMLPEPMTEESELALFSRKLDKEQWIDGRHRQCDSGSSGEDHHVDCRNLTNEQAIPLATRWFDLRYGAGTRGLPPAASVRFDGRPALIETGTPRGFFGTLRKGRTFGVEAIFAF